MNAMWFLLTILFAPLAPTSQGEHLPDPGLTLDLPQLEELVRSDAPGGDLVAAWSGKLGDSAVSIQVVVLDQARFGFDEPEDVLALIEGHHVERLAERKVGTVLGPREAVEGEFGWVPYAGLMQADLRRETALAGRLWLLCGLTASKGWALVVEAEPLPDAAGLKALRKFLEQGVRGEGEPRDGRWSDEEALARWQEFAPEDARDKFEDALRTEHYIILTNSSGGKKFGQKMEECYDTIQKIFPFPEVEGRRLMPVFLFRTPDQYYEYFAARAGISLEQARKSKGHAWLDYYATWYESPTDPVHIHEATHQIFANRLVLGGGGSWFQEGVAEYVETRANDRNNAARLVKKERHTPLREFVVIESLLMSAGDDVKGGSEAGDHYKQAALLIEFLRESKFGKPHFMDYVNAVGRLPRGDLEAIDRATQRVYGVDLAALDAAWVEYCKKR